MLMFVLVIGAMVLLGLNQAGALNILSAVAELVPTKHRGYVIGTLNFSAGAFVICGSLIGQEMAIHTGPGWRSVFWFVLATNIVATGLCFLTYFPAAPLGAHGRTKMEILRNFDYLGLLGLMSTSTLMLMGITWVPQYGATSPYFLGPFIVSVVLMLATGVYEAFFANNPLLHPFLFRRIRSFTLILVVSFVGGMLFYALQAFWPTYLALIFNGNNGRQTGIDGIPFGVGTQLGGVGSAMLLPILAPKIGTQWLLTIGVLLELIFIPMMYLVDENRKSMALAFTFLGGIG
jgi:MFS family permease